jgi:hypothetical protein
MLGRAAPIQRYNASHSYFSHKIDHSVFFIFVIGKDFVSDCDLLMACIIIQKQIEYINGNKENIIVPSVAMKKIRDQERTGIYAQFYIIDCVYCTAFS